VPEVREVTTAPDDPAGFPKAPLRRAPHGGPWFMDTLDVREGADGIRWFGIQRPVVAPLTPMAKVLGPADWTHGLARPPEPRLADPNIDLIVQLTRLPDGDWIGVRPSTRWARTGVGRGAGVLHDRLGEIGAVSMGVTLLPVEAPASA
jgi:Acyl-CoA thioesterase C-terminal domain